MREKITKITGEAMRTAKTNDNNNFGGKLHNETASIRTQIARARYSIIIYIYIVPGLGQMNPWGTILFRIIDILSYYPFPARCFL